MKYIGIYLTKYYRIPYADNFKTLMKEIKDILCWKPKTHPLKYSQAGISEWSAKMPLTLRTTINFFN